MQRWQWLSEGGKLQASVAAMKTSTDLHTNLPSCPSLAPLEAVVFDWSGTLVDFGVQAPAHALIAAFAQAFDFALTSHEVREALRQGEAELLTALARLPSVQERWRAEFGRDLNVADLEKVSQCYLPLQAELARAHGQLIPGAAASNAFLRLVGVRVGILAPYPRAVMTSLLEQVAEQGFFADATVCGDEVKDQTPSGSAQSLACLDRLGVSEPAHAVKVDDTPDGIAEGQRAGMWTVGVTLSGALCGWDERTYRRADALVREREHERIAALLREAGADVVIETVGQLPGALCLIRSYLHEGRKPPLRQRGIASRK